MERYPVKIAIGSGKIFGKGLFKGIQTQNSMVPVKESDLYFPWLVRNWDLWVQL